GLSGACGDLFAKADYAVHSSRHPRACFGRCERRLGCVAAWNGLREIPRRAAARRNRPADFSLCDPGLLAPAPVDRTDPTCLRRSQSTFRFHQRRARAAARKNSVDMELPRDPCRYAGRLDCNVQGFCALSQKNRVLGVTMATILAENVGLDFPIYGM